MTIYAKIITLAAVLVALAVGAQAQTPEIDALRARAEQGDADAQSILGAMYANGRGVLQDHAEAVRWYRLAAEQGLAGAQRNLGIMYQKGRGVSLDDAEAVRWFRLAAEQGNADAQFYLSSMLAMGQGVPQDDAECYMWISLAAAQSSGVDRDRRLKARDAFAERMTAERLAEAQRRARDWEVAHPHEP